MTVTLNLNPECEQGLLTQAQEHGVSLDVYLVEILNKQARINNAAAMARGQLINIPLVHLGVKSPLRRLDIYDDESVIDWAACPVLESVQGKLGGAWVFRGTRVPYTTVLQNIGDMSVSEIAESFPSVRPEQITTFLEFVAKSAEPRP